MAGPFGLDCAAARSQRGGWETDPLLYSPLAGDLVSPASRLRWRRYYRATDGDGDDCPQGCAARSGVDFACHLSGFNLGHLFAFGKAAYAATYLEAPSARTLSLSLAADDNAQFWVNGGAVSGVGSATCTASAGCVARTVSVALPAGTSLLLAKVWKNAAGSASGRQQGRRRLCVRRQPAPLRLRLEAGAVGDGGQPRRAHHGGGAGGRVPTARRAAALGHSLTASCSASGSDFCSGKQGFAAAYVAATRSATVVVDTRLAFPSGGSVHAWSLLAQSAVPPLPSVCTSPAGCVDIRLGFPSGGSVHAWSLLAQRQGQRQGQALAPSSWACSRR